MCNDFVLFLWCQSLRSSVLRVNDGEIHSAHGWTRREEEQEHCVGHSAWCVACTTSMKRSLGRRPRHTPPSTFQKMTKRMTGAGKFVRSLLLFQRMLGEAVKNQIFGRRSSLPPPALAPRSSHPLPSSRPRNNT